MSMQKIMRWGHDFPKEYGGKLFKPLGQWGKAKCQRQNCWPDFLTSPTKEK